MRNMNSFFLQGRIAQDAVYKETERGTPVVRFAVAVNRDRKNSDGEWEKNVSFFPVVLFDHYASKYKDRLTRGKEILLEGHLRQNRWESNGEKHSEIALSVDWLNLPCDKAPEVSDEKTETVPDIPPETEPAAGENHEMYGDEGFGYEEIPF